MFSGELTLLLTTGQRPNMLTIQYDTLSSTLTPGARLWTLWREINRAAGEAEKWMVTGHADPITNAAAGP